MIRLLSSMLNLIMNLGPGSSPDPNIYYRTPKKGALQNERIAARPLSMRFGVVMAAKSARTVENLTVQAHLNWRCLVFATPGVDIILFFCLCRVQNRQMCFEPARLTFFPEFFQIKAHSKQKQLCPYVPFASRKESAESKIIFEQAKGTLHLDRTA